MIVVPDFQYHNIPAFKKSWHCVFYLKRKAKKLSYQFASTIFTCSSINLSFVVFKMKFHFCMSELLFYRKKNRMKIFRPSEQ